MEELRQAPAGKLQIQLTLDPDIDVGCQVAATARPHLLSRFRVNLLSMRYKLRHWLLHGSGTKTASKAAGLKTKRRSSSRRIILQRRCSQRSDSMTLAIADYT